MDGMWKSAVVDSDLSDLSAINDFQDAHVCTQTKLLQFFYASF